MDDRLRQRLSMMGKEIESVLIRNQVQSPVRHESLDGGIATFVAQECGPVAVTTWDAIEAECRRQLCGTYLEMTLEGHDLRIAVDLTGALSLPGLLLDYPAPIMAVSLIGLDVDERPVTLRFGGRNAQHVLFFGGPGSGKTSALRTSAVSLAATSRQAQAQMIFIAPRAGREEANGPGLDTLHYLPHALAAVARSLEDVANVLAFVAEELQHRRRCEVSEPSIIVFIDDLDLLVGDGGAPVGDPLRMLLAEGTAYGIYLVMAARPVEPGGGADITNLLALKAISQILGQLDTRARAPAGGRYEDAQNLRGRGDFLFTSGSEQRRFQAAHVDTDDLLWWLKRLQSQRPARLLARTYA